MKKINWIMSVLMGISGAVLSMLPVSAVTANPDSIVVHTAKVFQNIFETGDMLFVVSYDVSYNATPTTPADDTFLVNLIDTNGTTTLMFNELNYYQYNLISIYATAAQVASVPLTWGSAYRLRVLGNPAMFGTLTEDVNMDTKVLSGSDWNADGTLTSKELLKEHLIDIAEALEIDWGVTLLTVTTDGEKVLNSVATPYFSLAIPGIIDKLPSLFQLSRSVPIVPQSETGGKDVPTAGYAIASKIDARLGPQLSGAIKGVGTFLGIGDNSAAGLWAIIFILVVASIVFLNTGNSGAAMVLAIPIVVLMTFLGAIPEAITYVVTIFIAVYALYFFWLRGT